MGRKAPVLDLLKVMALMAVFGQGITGALLSGQPKVEWAVMLVLLTQALKFSAPFFIFAICIDLAEKSDADHQRHIRTKARHLLLPYAGWTVAYLLASVSMHAFAPLRIISALLLGTAAPHLWYVVMMFQFQLLAPACRRARLCVARGRGHTAVLLSFGFLTSLAYILLYRHFSPALPSWADLLFNRGFIGFMAFGCLGIAILAEEERGARWPAVIPPLAGLLVVPVFLLACREALPHGIAPSLHQVIYLKPSTFLYNVLLLAAAYGGARFCVLRGWGAGPAIRWLSSMAYKAFLANVFVSRLILWCLGLVNLEVTNLPSLLAVWLATAIGSFALAHAIDCLGKSMIYMNWRPERIRHDVHE